MHHYLPLWVSHYLLSQMWVNVIDLFVYSFIDARHWQRQWNIPWLFHLLDWKMCSNQPWSIHILRGFFQNCQRHLQNTLYMHTTLHSQDYVYRIFFSGCAKRRFAALQHFLPLIGWQWLRLSATQWTTAQSQWSRYLPDQRFGMEEF